MVTRRVGLFEITTIKQSGFVNLCEIENDDDLRTIDVDRLVGGGSNILVSADTVFKLSNRYSYIKKKAIR